VALPALESLGGSAAVAAAATLARPKRLLFLGFGWGVTDHTWFPNRSQTGRGYTLPEGLAPLAKHQGDLTVVQGCVNRLNRDGHAGSSFWLTGADRYGVPGVGYHNTISADQVAAATLGRDTRFTSLQFACRRAVDSGHGGSMSWNARGKPLSGFETPAAAYGRLFFEDDVPLEQKKALLVRRRSVLDAVRTDATSVRQSLAPRDADKLDEYLEGIRDIERRLTKEEQWMATPRPKTELREPSESLAGTPEIEAMYDLITAAFQTDSSRVITYRQPVESLLESLKLPHAGHDVSHYVPGTDREASSRRRDAEQSRLLARLIDRLKAAKEPDGSSLFDHVTLVYGSNIRMHHHLDNCPTILAGGGAGIRLGEHIVLADGTPLCNVWLTLLQGAGVDVANHGDSTGVVEQLLG